MADAETDDVPERTDAFYGRVSLGPRRSYLRLFGELDLASAAAANRLIARAEHSSAGEVVIDLGGVHFIDSTGLSLLLCAHRRLGERLTLLPPQPSVRSLFARTRTDRLLPFAD
jgi:anti-sigma B factor antagonist